MGVKIISLDCVEEIQLEGRIMKRMITEETTGAKNLTVAVIWVPPLNEVSPCHSHDAEEAVYILRGSGEAYVDGETKLFSPGDVVWFPRNSKHMIRNTSRTGNLQAVCIFSPPIHPSQYVLYNSKFSNSP